MAPTNEVQVTVIGAGVVGCAVALALARRGVAVALLEAEPDLALGASGTNSGILHTGFDSAAGELETELILASNLARDPLLRALAIPVLRCGAVMRPHDESERATVAGIPAVARRNGVHVVARDDGALEIPDEAVTDPVAYALALAAEAERHGADVHTRARVDSVEAGDRGLTVRSAGGLSVRCGVAVNSAGLEADAIARLAGDDSFFDLSPGKASSSCSTRPPASISTRSCCPSRPDAPGVCSCFPRLTARSWRAPPRSIFEDKRDWSVRPAARDEIVFPRRLRCTRRSSTPSPFRVRRPASGRTWSELRDRPRADVSAACPRRRDPLDRVDRVARYRRARHRDRGLARGVARARGGAERWSCPTPRPSMVAADCRVPSRSDGMTLLLGIDEGTSAVKAVLYDSELRPLAEARREKRLSYPRPGWVEQDATEVLTRWSMPWPSCSPKPMGRWPPAGSTTRGSRCSPGTRTPAGH